MRLSDKTKQWFEERLGVEVVFDTDWGTLSDCQNGWILYDFLDGSAFTFDGKVCVGNETAVDIEASEFIKMSIRDFVELVAKGGVYK